MATRNLLTDVNFNQNEAQNLVIQNLASAPANPKAGQHYFNTADGLEYVYNGTAWVNALSQGTSYTFSQGVQENSGTVTARIASGANAGNVALSQDANGLKAQVAEASTSAKGIIEIATDAEATTGTSEVLAVNPKQLASAVADKIKLTDLSIASGSANYLGYDNTNGEISAKVDTTVTASSTNLVTSGAVSSAIDSALSSAYKAAGSVAFASLPTLTKANEGKVYNVTDAFTTTADFVEGAGKEYPAGTNVVCINTTGTTYKWDVLAGFVDTSAFITASSTDTLTNKTIDADDNTISDLTTSNLKSGVLQTSVRAVSSASDSALASEKAIATALADKVEKIAEDNPSLTVSSGAVTWEITNTIGSADVVCSIREKSSGEEVYPKITYSASKVTIEFNASANVSAGTYRAVIVG